MRLHGFNLNQLVCLDALLREANVSRAADRVHLSQSAMSAVLAQLRDHFADPLLVRSGQGMVLTPFARSLAAPLGEVMSRAQAFSALRPDAPALSVDRELKIVASDYSFEAFLGRAIRASLSRMPGLRHEVLPLTAGSARMVASGEVDLLLAGQRMDVGIAPGACVFEDRFVCLECTNCTISGNWGPDAFFSRRHVVVRYFENQLAFEDEEAVRRTGRTREVQASVWSYGLVPAMIAGTGLIASVPESISGVLVARAPLRTLPFPLDHDPVRVFAYWHPSRNADPVLRRFLEYLEPPAG